MLRLITEFRRSTAIALIAASLFFSAAVAAQETANDESQLSWPFKSLRSVPVPAAGSALQTGGRSPVDAYILAALHQRQAASSPPADRRVQIRRLTFDLLGLPPTPE